jgi:hypothetical protein
MASWALVASGDGRSVAGSVALMVSGRRLVAPQMRTRVAAPAAAVTITRSCSGTDTTHTPVALPSASGSSSCGSEDSSLLQCVSGCISADPSWNTRHTQRPEGAAIRRATGMREARGQTARTRGCPFASFNTIGPCCACPRPGRPVQEKFFLKKAFVYPAATGNSTGDDGLRHVAPIGEAGCGTGGTQRCVRVDSDSDSDRSLRKRRDWAAIYLPARAVGSNPPARARSCPRKGSTKRRHRGPGSGIVTSSCTIL